MRRDFSRGALAALAIVLASPPALADDLVDTAKKASAAKQTLGNKVDALTTAAQEKKDRAIEAADEAKGRALDAADEAKSRGRETADDLQDRFDEAKYNANAYAHDLKDQLGDRANKMGDDARGMVDKIKLWFKTGMQGVRDSLRDSLHEAADKFDNQAKDARDGARNEQWAKLRTRYGLPDHAPTMVVSEELRIHEERIARLRRARELADSVDDQTSVTRADHLAEREFARHRRQLKHLLEMERREKALSEGQELSYGGDEE